MSAFTSEEHKPQSAVGHPAVEGKVVNKFHHIASDADYRDRRDDAKARQEIVCVDFFATWCGPCKAIAPELDVLAAENPNVFFLKVDVDALARVAADANVTAMPTFKFYYGDVEVASARGANIGKVKAALAVAEATKIKMAA